MKKGKKEQVWIRSEQRYTKENIYYHDGNFYILYRGQYLEVLPSAITEDFENITWYTE